MYTYYCCGTNGHLPEQIALSSHYLDIISQLSGRLPSCVSHAKKELSVWELELCCLSLCLQSHCAEPTAERGRIDHSFSVRGSLLVILAMTMTMAINSNSVLLICVTSAGQDESFEHVQNFRVPNANTLHSWLCALKTCSYLLCRTAYMLYSSHSNYSCM